MVSTKRQTKYLKSRNKYKRFFKSVQKPFSKTGRNAVILKPNLYEEFLTEVSRCEILKKDVEVQILILILFSTGCRIGEILELKVGQINLDRQLIEEVKISKKRDRILTHDKPVHSASIAILSEFIKTKSLDENLFDKIRNRYTARRRIKAYLGDELGGAHEARHSLVSYMLAPCSRRSGESRLTDLQVVSYFGWSHSSVAVAYSHSDRESVFNLIFENSQSDKKAA